MTNDLPPEYLTRYQVLALGTTDLRCLGLALYVETNIAVVTGGARSPRTTRLVDAFAAVAEQSGDPYVRGQEQSTRALLELEQGQWARGREHGAQAVMLLRERCLGASY
jgi:hypothetical protein